MFVWPAPHNHLDIYCEGYFVGACHGFGYTDYDRDKQPMIPTFREYLRRIETITPAKGTMLDVGAATGFFLDLARQRDWTVCGIELSDHAATLGRIKGLDVRTGTLEQCTLPPASFDVITMWDVIEHLPDPHATLTRVKKLLRPGGILAINTPDSGSFLARALGTKWHLVVPPEHLNLFHRRSVQTLLEKHGFLMLEISSIGKSFTVEYVLQTLAHWLNVGGFETAASWVRGRRIGGLGMPINLRDNMFVLAQN